MGGAGEMDIYVLDQACADIDKNYWIYTKNYNYDTKYSRKKMKIDKIKENEKRKKT